MREKYSDACFSRSFGWPPFWSTDNSPRTRARTIDPRMIISSSVPSNAPPSLAKFFSVRRHKSIQAPLILPLVLLLHRRSRFHLSLSIYALHIRTLDIMVTVKSTSKGKTINTYQPIDCSSRLLWIPSLSISFSLSSFSSYLSAIRFLASFFFRIRATF